MNYSGTFATVALITLFSAPLDRADDWPQWRGPQRDGISKETGLLSEWPAGGPKLLWEHKETGRGYSTPSVVGPVLYVLGNDGVENEFVEALSVNDGQQTWRTRIGQAGNPKQEPNFPGARSTPTVNGAVLVALGSDGDLAVLEARDGKVRWQKNLRRDFGGKPGQWAYAESPLVDGDKIICTPGGAEATLVALDKNTGAVIWKAKVPGGDEAAYSSPIIVNAGGIKQYVQMLGKGLVGVEVRTGKFLWRYDKTVSRYGANIPTPVADGDFVFCAGAGTGGGLVKLNVRDGAAAAEQIYFSPKLPTAIGGAIKLGEYLYGTTGQSMVCVNFRTGEVKWEERGLGAASLCLADGRFYLHGENGEVALVEATPDVYREKGHFAPPDQPEKSNPMEKAWAYPVVANGRLYVRDHNLLWCYDVKAR